MAVCDQLTAILFEVVWVAVTEADGLGVGEKETDEVEDGVTVNEGDEVGDGEMVTIGGVEMGIGVGVSDGKT